MIQINSLVFLRIAVIAMLTVSSAMAAPISTTSQAEVSWYSVYSWLKVTHLYLKVTVSRSVGFLVRYKHAIYQKKKINKNWRHVVYYAVDQITNVCWVNSTEKIAQVHSFLLLILSFNCWSYKNDVKAEKRIFPIVNSSNLSPCEWLIHKIISEMLMRLK